MRTAAEDRRMDILLREFDRAIAEEESARTRAHKAADELIKIGVDVYLLRSSEPSGDTMDIS